MYHLPERPCMTRGKPRSHLSHLSHLLKRLDQISASQWAGILEYSGGTLSKYTCSLGIAILSET